MISPRLGIISLLSESGLSDPRLSDEECVFSKDVTVDVWRNLTDSVRDAKMPSDEFFQ